MNRNPEELSEERMQILRMVEQGNITAQEAAQLLASLQGSPPASNSAAQAPNQTVEFNETPLPEQPFQVQPSPDGPRWMRVRVTDLSTGRRKVTVNLPIGLVNWGLKIGARYAPEVRDIDFSDISEMLQAGAEGKLVDVIDEEDGEHVEVFVD
jgi:hypothetical protein